MAVSVRELWSSLIRLGLCDARQAEALSTRLRGSLAAQADPAGDIDAEDPLGLAKLLVAQRLLTPFQAKQIVAGRVEDLLVGGYRIVDRLKLPPLTRWYRAHHLASGAAAIVYPCGSAIESRDYVDLQWLRPHLALTADALQPLDFVQLNQEDPASRDGWRGLIVSALPDGQTLDRWLQESDGFGTDAALSIATVVGGALAAMHRASLFHGGLRPGRVWVGREGAVFLLRCGGGPPIFPGDPVAPGYDWFEDDGQAGNFAAPEWLSGQIHADASSDVYSLGALVHYVATGKPVQSHQLSEEVRRALQAGTLGDPLMRVLGAAMAPDRSRRFADVEGFLRAIRVLQSPHETPSVAEHKPQVAQSSAPHAMDRAESDPLLRSVRNSPSESVAQVIEDRSAATPWSGTNVSAPSPSVAVTKVLEGDSRLEMPVESRFGADAPSQARPQSAQRPGVVRPGKRGSTPMPLREVTPKTQPVASARPAAEVSAASPRSDSPVAAEHARLIGAVSASQSGADSARRPVRKRKRRSHKGPILIGAGLVSAFLLGLALVLMNRQAPREQPVQRPTPRPVVPLATAEVPRKVDAALPSETASPGGFELVSDDRLLWAPPWPAGSQAPPLELLVPGAQAVVSLRPQAILSGDSAADWRGWFGRELDPAISDLTKRAGVDLEQIDRLVLGLVAGTDGQPEVSWVIWLAQPIPLGTLRERWGVSASKMPTGQTIWAADDPSADAYFVRGDVVGDTTEVTAFAVGSLESIRAIAEGDGGAIPMPVAMQSAWDQTSDQAELVALVSPNFLFADGRELLSRFAPRAVESLRLWLIPDVLAMAVTIDTRERWYGEVRLVPGGGLSVAGLLRALQDRVEGLPALAEGFLIDGDIDASWRPMAIRLPQYLMALQAQSRYGISNSMPLANFYLPAPAAPQVALASLLAMSSSGTAPAVAPATPSPAAEMMSIEQLLESELSISFEQESLEFAINMIGEEFARSLSEGQPRPKITILGNDLEKSGITQNQQVRDFKMSAVPFREVLTRLVAGANPDKTATSTADEKQSLVWVVDPEATDQAPGILITTRPQAAAKGWQLPHEFLPGV